MSQHNHSIIDSTTNTVFYCSCRALPSVPCWYRVAAAGDMCAYCAAGDHRGHMRAHATDRQKDEVKA